MTSSMCAHTYCGTNVKVSKQFIWGLKCTHVFHDHCVSQTARQHCPACHILAPVRIWDPAASHCHCFLSTCKGHSAPRPVCSDCTPAFESRLRTTVIDVYKQHNRPGRIVDVLYLFFSQATMLPEWFRLSSFTEQTLDALHTQIKSHILINPIIAGIWKHAAAFFETSAEVVVEQGYIWPTQYYYLHTLKSLPIGLCTVNQLSKAASTTLNQLTQREAIFTLWSRTHEGRQVTVHRRAKSSEVYYRRATKHTIISPETLLRAVGKKHSRGVPLVEIWAEHEQAHTWLLEFVDAGKLIILEQRVYSTNTVASLTGVSMKECQDLVFEIC